jgi:zinc transporter, ZIP family
VAASLGWGALAASSLVIGALLALARRWPSRQVGLVLAFGAGALISAVSFELAQEGLAVGDAGSTALGLAAGALTYYVLDGLLARGSATGRGRSGRSTGSSPGSLSSSSSGSGSLPGRG